MNYNLQEHGEFLEREAIILVRAHFPNYEKVWSAYVGNKGNESIADLPNYPDENKRKNFAENSYTVLESFFIIHRILESEIFEKSITTFENYIEFNKAFITIFTLLGRIHDTVIKASYVLGYDNDKFKKSIHAFYEARNVVVHGKKVPLIFDELGLLKIPILKTSIVQGIAWDDRNYLWNDAGKMSTEYASDRLTDFFYQLIKLVNNEYAVFYHIISAELKKSKLSLKFEYQPFLYLKHDQSGNVSGTFSYEGADVYGFRSNPLKRK